MSGENILVYGTTLVLEDSGAAIANGVVALAPDSGYSIVGNGGGYPDAIFVLTCQFGTAPVEGSVISLYAQPLGIDGALNAQAPEATRPTVFVGSFVVNDVITSQSMTLKAYDVERNANYYLHNNGTGQSIATGWKLTVTPRTNKAAP